jgi:hypothetical protein
VRDAQVSSMHVAGASSNRQLPAGAQHAGDHGDGLLPLGHVVDDAEVDNGVVAGARLLDVADVAERKRHSAPVRRLRATSTMVSSRSTAATRRRLVRHAIRYRPRAPLYQRLITDCRTRPNGHDISVQIDGTQGPKDGDVTRHILVIDGNTGALELGSAHMRQAARARTHRPGTRRRSDGRQRPDDVVVS